jgi:hypothetical protein
VDIRATLTRAEQVGVISAVTRVTLEALAKTLYYPDRSYPRLAHDARAAGVPAGEIDAFDAWVPAGRVEQKKQDALALLRTLREWRDRDPSPQTVTWHFEHTDVWDQVSRRSGRQLASANPQSLPDDLLMEELRLEKDAYASAITGAFARALALAEADHHGVVVDAPLFRSTIEAFRREHELLDSPSVLRWMEAQQLDRAGFQALMAQESRVRWVRTMFEPDITRQLVEQLRVSGVFGRLADRAREKRRVLSDLGVADAAVGDAPLDAAALLRWFFVERRGEAPPADVTLAAWRLGYRDADTFLQALLREYYFVMGLSTDARG